MPDAYVGQIIFVVFPFTVNGYAICNGAMMNIRQNQALHALIGTTFGGDGVTTFKLPDLRGRVAVGQGLGVGWHSYLLGSYGGAEEVTLTAEELPSHSHGINAATVAGSVSAADNILATTAKNTVSGSIPTPMYAPPSAVNPPVALSAETVSSIGEGKGHPNMQPFLVANPLIAVTGLFPSFS